MSTDPNAPVVMTFVVPFTPEQEARIRELIREELAKQSEALAKRIVAQIQAQMTMRV
jgi:hypothetical protein